MSYTFLKTVAVWLGVWKIYFLFIYFMKWMGFNCCEWGQVFGHFNSHVTQIFDGLNSSKIRPWFLNPWAKVFAEIWNKEMLVFNLIYWGFASSLPIGRIRKKEGFSSLPQGDKIIGGGSFIGKLSCQGDVCHIKIINRDACDSASGHTIEFDIHWSTQSPYSSFPRA